MAGTHFIFLLILQIATILILSRVVGTLFLRVRQPQVMGEMVAGIMLGPSLFGLVWPSAYAHLFPKESVGNLNALSQIGVIFFLFLIGLELDPKLLRNRGRVAVMISHASIVAPFVLGASLAWYLYPRLFTPAIPNVRFLSVLLFMGAAMSITAFPVLARILTERNMHRTHVGAIAITCAAVDDVTAWCILAFVVAIARAAGVGPGLMTAGKAVIYVLIMFFVVRPFLKRLAIVYERNNRLSQNLMAIIFILVLLSSLATEWIGIHALFGAFLMGTIMPKNSRFVHTLAEKLEDYTVVLLLPIFFAYTGLNTSIGLLDRSSLWGYTALILLAASVGKFGGAGVAARLCGMPWRQASAIGILMNTRGLMELVILNIGRDLGVIPPTVFAMMVIMALVTTALTTPILHWTYPQVELEALSSGAPVAGRRVFTVLIPVSLPSSGGPLASMAGMLAPAIDSSRRIIALHLQRPIDRDAYNTAEVQAAAREAESLAPLLAASLERHIEVEPIAFVSRDVPSDISRVARARQADLILMGFHKPVFGQAILGGTVHRVLTGSDTDVAVFVDRGLTRIRTVMVPYLGGIHDRLALELAGRVARNAKASLTVLHVVPPKRNDQGAVQQARTVVERTFAEPKDPLGIEFKVIEDTSPVQAVIAQAQTYDLVVIGVEEQWGLESHLFGWRPERIGRDTPVSLLIVRKYAAAHASATSTVPETAAGDTRTAPAFSAPEASSTTHSG